MDSRLVLGPGARSDIREAAHWYESQQSGLGDRFLKELDYLFGRIKENPLQFPLIADGVRRGFQRSFPYGAYFIAKANRVEVIAVLNLHRRSGSWVRKI